jgi:hypothetical protein
VSELAVPIGETRRDIPGTSPVHGEGYFAPARRDTISTVYFRDPEQNSVEISNGG